MTTRSVLARAVAARVDRLRATFAALHAAVKEKVAEVVGAAAADAVRAAVRAVLDAAPPPPAAPRRPTAGGWGEDDPDADGWGDDADWPPPARPARDPAPGRRARLLAAVLAGGRAAGWWLARAADRPGWG